ncbi:cobalt-precorrin 5A hydrolase/precorrin-3B C17-methyltransferase [Brevirhabdus pacifica]|nr:precorrin-3B C(17)-methyltransferase [Brevirhabdus pacifica]PJJ85376.1 cobalt-precorrin 5A hydrolase/precorrin-3B C17-methyltransferase [Brevirhabdus pacifica]
MSETVLVAILPSALPLAERLAGELGARVDLRGRDFDDVATHLRALFLAGHAIVGIASSGILIRCLAPLLSDKRAEPPVLALSEDGSAVVPLLGGHRGANALARRIAAMIEGAGAAITTTGDARLGVALDEPPAGWMLENPSDAKPAMAALLGGAPARQSGRADWLAPLAEQLGDRLTGSDAADADAPVVLSVEGCEPLIWRRRRLMLGLGAARGCPVDEMQALVMATLAENGYAPGDIAAVHSVDLKSDEAAIHAVARFLNVPARFHPVAELEAQTPRLANPSDVVFDEIGCHGVAEAAALLAAGPEGRLTVEKVKSANATCALALPGSDEGGAAEGAAPGTPRGHLAVVGIGPGKADWRTPEASRLIAEADELVGYGLYLDLLGPWARTKQHREFDLGEEEARCRYALERAGEGRRVALICSGDAGIYAMGALVMELVARPEDEGGVTAPAKRVAITHAPGISALQAASARAGALLGHDFCAISLSDLLTYRDAITRRVTAAAEGDFVIAFYNPVSRRRRTLLEEARQILLKHRPATTPVLLASNLGRPDETLRLRDLGSLDTDEVDMLTIVLIGASTSRVARSGDGGAGAEGNWIFTPRGYARKIDGDLS